ncbi:hypothetical protein MMC25_007160 [Agyrium rufum]|nr:hypothetical protein [Agyrium rufum]
MFALSNPFRRIFRGGPQFSGTQPIKIAPVEVHDIETGADKRSRTLKHLLKLNHVTHSIVYHDLQYHNHLPHILGSAYLLNSSPEHLSDIYEAEAKELDKWVDSPGEVSEYDWRDYLGDPHYQRAYVDFFEDQLVLHGYDWKGVVEKFLFEGKAPLVNCLVAGLAHPLIHLGYAFELSSKELAMEALGLAATQHNFLHKYLDDPSYSNPSLAHSEDRSNDLFDIFARVAKDTRLDGAANAGIEGLFKTHEAVVLEYWNAWTMTDPEKQFKHSQSAATALLAVTPQPAGKFNFFFVHLLTSSHAVRILLPVIPAKFHVSLVRQWWLITLTLFCIQYRPDVDTRIVADYDLGGRDWDWVLGKAVSGKHSIDAHYVKALRSMKIASDTWGDEDQFYLKAAVKFGAEFDGWGGFRAHDMACELDEM